MLKKKTNFEFKLHIYELVKKKIHRSILSRSSCLFEIRLLALCENAETTYKRKKGNKLTLKDENERGNVRPGMCIGFKSENRMTNFIYVRICLMFIMIYYSPWIIYYYSYIIIL